MYTITTCQLNFVGLLGWTENREVQFPGERENNSGIELAGLREILPGS